MSKEDAIEVMATVLEPAAQCYVQSRIGKQAPGTWRTFGQKCPAKNFIRILPGDKVAVELSPYDLNRGRIVYRYKMNSSYIVVIPSEARDLGFRKTNDERPRTDL